MASTAWCAWACSSGSGRTAWPRPVLPWISLASLTEIDSAVGAPGQTGMSARPASLRTARVLRVAAARRNVADDRGDAEDLRLFVRAGVEQRQGVVDAGVDVDDEGLGRLGHGGALGSLMSPLRLRSNAAG